MHCCAMPCAGAMPPAPPQAPAAVNMAIYSFRMQVIGRSAGRSATAAAAYRSGEQVKDERTGQVHDYTGKSDIYASEILVPEGAPERLGDRASLWNEVERNEKRKDSQLCNEIMIALPAELSHAQKQELAREYVQGEFVSQGMIADIGYHDFDSHNPHAHIMLTMRPVNEEGFGKKERKWNKRDAVREYRSDWAEYANLALERAGLDERIDHRSLKEQGIEREPQIHLGAKVMEMEARGVQTRVGDESRRISAVNLDIERQEAQREKLQVEIEAEQSPPHMYILPELVFSDELESEIQPAPPAPPMEPLSAPIEQPVKRSVPIIDRELAERVCEAIARRREEMILENSPVVGELAEVIEKIAETMNELSAAAEEVTEKIEQVLAKGDKEPPVLTDKRLRQPQPEIGQTTQADGVAEVILRKMTPDNLARYQAQITKAKVPEPPIEDKQVAESEDKRRRRRQIYQQYAERVGGGASSQLQDQKVAEQILVEMVRENRGKLLTLQDKQLAAAIMAESSESLRIEQTEGKDSAHQYAISILKEANQQLIAQEKSVNQANQKERGGMEL